MNVQTVVALLIGLVAGYIIVKAMQPPQVVALPATTTPTPTPVTGGMTASSSTAPASGTLTAAPRTVEPTALDSLAS